MNIQIKIETATKNGCWIPKSLASLLPRPSFKKHPTTSWGLGCSHTFPGLWMSRVAFMFSPYSSGSLHSFGFLSISAWKTRQIREDAQVLWYSISVYFHQICEICEMPFNLVTHPKTITCPYTKGAISGGSLPTTIFQWTCYSCRRSN